MNIGIDMCISTRSPLRPGPATRRLRSSARSILAQKLYGLIEEEIAIVDEAVKLNG